MAFTTTSTTAAPTVILNDDTAPSTEASETKAKFNAIVSHLSIDYPALTDLEVLNGLVSGPTETIRDRHWAEFMKRVKPTVGGVMSDFETAATRTLMRDVRDSMRARHFTDQVSREDLLFLSPNGETVVFRNALQDDSHPDRRPVSLHARWVSRDVTITQNDSNGVRELCRVLRDAGPHGRAIVETSDQEPLATYIEYDGQRRRVVLPDPLGKTVGDVEAFFVAIRTARIRQAAAEYGLPLEYAEAMFDGAQHDVRVGTRSG